MYLDLHVHLRGTISPSLAFRLAERNQLNTSVFSEQAKTHSWNGLPSFIDAYERVADVVRTPSDLAIIAFEYLRECSASGTRYVEFMLSPLDMMRKGVDFQVLVSILSDVNDRCKAMFDVESRLIATCVRHRGPEDANETAKLVEEYQHPYVVGFGLTGDELSYDADLFTEAFRRAAGAGLKRTAHVGEIGSAVSILKTVDCLDLQRIGHGIRACENPDVLSELAVRQIGLEVCISSNVALGLSDNLETHCIREMVKKGCLVALGTDDPAFFQTDPVKEYALAVQACNLDIGEMTIFNKNAITMAFCDAATKVRLMSFLDQY